MLCFAGDREAQLLHIKRPPPPSGPAPESECPCQIYLPCAALLIKPQRTRPSLAAQPAASIRRPASRASRIRPAFRSARPWTTAACLALETLPASRRTQASAAPSCARIPCSFASECWAGLSPVLVCAFLHHCRPLDRPGGTHRLCFRLACRSFACAPPLDAVDRRSNASVGQPSRRGGGPLQIPASRNLACATNRAAATFRPLSTGASAPGSRSGPPSMPLANSLAPPRTASPVAELRQPTERSAPLLRRQILARPVCSGRARRTGSRRPVKRPSRISAAHDTSPPRGSPLRLRFTRRLTLRGFTLSRRIRFSAAPRLLPALFLPAELSRSGLSNRGFAAWLRRSRPFAALLPPHSLPPSAAPDPPSHAAASSFPRRSAAARSLHPPSARASSPAPRPAPAARIPRAESSPQNVRWPRTSCATRDFVLRSAPPHTRDCRHRVPVEPAPAPSALAPTLLATLNRHAAAQPLQLLFARLPGHLHQVSLLHARSGLRQQVRQLAVVGHQQQAFALVVKPPHRIQPFLHLREELHHRRPAFGIAHRGHVALRLVQHKIPVPLGAMQQLAVHANVVARRIGLASQRCVTTCPFTITRPATIISSACRRLAIPACDKIFCSRSSFPGSRASSAPAISRGLRSVAAAASFAACLARSSFASSCRSAPGSGFQARVHRRQVRVGPKRLHLHLRVSFGFARVGSAFAIRRVPDRINNRLANPDIRRNSPQLWLSSSEPSLAGAQPSVWPRSPLRRALSRARPPAWPLLWRPSRPSRAWHSQPLPWQASASPLSFWPRPSSSSRRFLSPAPLTPLGRRALCRRRGRFPFHFFRHGKASVPDYSGSPGARSPLCVEPSRLDSDSASRAHSARH